MAQTKVTADLLSSFAQTLRSESSRFNEIKNSMDNELNSFLWDDPVSAKFKAQYAEGLAPLKSKLLPAMDRYQEHLDKEAGIIRDEWLQN
ncbi:MAG: hypothetical protein LBQ01_02825 [Prevotellaceae bacterium]|jgi:hypothetical protein|nr:hypothetical protein [Prevotellaceae bacterium]